MAIDRVLAFSTGIEDAATQRAVRALERAMNAANSSISALQSSSSSSGVPTSRLISTSAPLAGGGSLAANLTLSISPGSNGDVLTTVAGVPAWAAPSAGGVSSVAAGSSMVTVSPTTGAVVVNVAPANFTGIPESGVTNLTTDLAAKAPTSRLINTTAPLSGGGNLTADRTLSIATNGISNSLLAQGPGTSVVGVSGGATANRADIVSSTAGDVLANVGGALSFTGLAALVAALARGFFGDGYDGALNFDGVTTVTLGDGTTIVPAASVYNLPRDIQATTVSVSTGVVIEGKGFFIFANVSVTGAGTATIRCNGGNGANGTGAAGGVGGTAAVSVAARYNSLTTAGGAGSATLGGTAGTATMQLNPQRATAAGGILSGGAGGAGSGGAGGTAGLAATGGTNQGTYRTFTALTSGRTSQGTQLASFGGSSGGGGGGTTGGTGGGGGGGAGGGYFGLFTPQVIGALKLQCVGGNGGSATAGNAGGGGGGSGGRIGYLVWAGGSNLTIDVSGGTGGAKTGTGVAGNSGGTGEIIPL